jgi:YHS domain-containing protein
MKPYQYKNKLCPICGKAIDAYQYKMNRKGVKYCITHTDDEVV